jgi:pullulanase/glycogen debranching enzyme
MTSMNRKDPMQKSTKPKRMRRPKGPMPSVAGQAAEKADASTDLTMSERPLHDYLAEVSERTDVRVGVPLPLGTYARGGGVNFAFASRHASCVRLELFDHPENATAAGVIDLGPARNRTGDVWHVWIQGVPLGQLYAYRVDRFTRGMIAFRRAHPILSQEHFYTDAEIHWFGPEGGLPNWADPKEKQFTCLIHEDAQRALCLMFNAGVDAVDVGLPPVPPGTRWHVAVDPSREAPQDLFAVGEEPLWEDPQTYHLSPRSSVILLAR